MGSTKRESQIAWGRPCGSAGRAEASVPNAAARAILESATHLITIDGCYRDRLTRLAWAKDRWVTAQPGREVIVMKGGSGQHADRWVAVFVEDDKGVLSIQGVSLEDALERALALLEPSGPGRTND